MSGQRSRRPARATGVAAHVSRRWFIAGLAASAAAVGAMHLPILAPVDERLTPLIAIVAGWAFAMMMRPRRAIRRADFDRQDLQRLAAAIDTITKDDQRRPIPRTFLERPDALGDLSRRLHTLVSMTIATRIENHNLQRTLEERVRRETSRVSSELRHESGTDELTGLANRQSIGIFLDQLRSASPAEREAAAALMIAIDLPEGLPPTAVSTCERFMASTLSASLGPNDLAARLDDRRFLALLPSADGDDVTETARQLIALFAEMPWPHGELPRPTITIGVVVLPPAALGEPRVLIDGAGAALAMARRRGALVHIDDETDAAEAA